MKVWSARHLYTMIHIPILTRHTVFAFDCKSVMVCWTFIELSQYLIAITRFVEIANYITFCCGCIIFLARMVTGNAQIFILRVVVRGMDDLEATAEFTCYLPSTFGQIELVLINCELWECKGIV